MICQNCHHEVANDLIFCTDCGARLHETFSQTPTALINDSIVTKISAAQPKKSSKTLPLVIVALIVAVATSSFIAYRLLSGGKNNQLVSNNAEKPVAKNTLANKTTPNSTGNITNVLTNVSNGNTNLANTNVPVAENSSAAQKAEIWNEQIEIAPGEHYAVPFKLDTDSRLTGTVKLVSGASIEGYVYLQTQYDEHFPDPTYKMFSFEGKDEANVSDRLVKENYVLIFVNQTQKPLTVKGNFSAVPE